MAGYESLIAQYSSIFSVVVSFAALAVMATSLHLFSKSRVKNAMIGITLQAAILFGSVGLMSASHVFNGSVALELWHIGSMVTMITGIGVSLYIIIILRSVRVDDSAKKK